MSGEGPVSVRAVAGLGNPGRRYEGTRHNVGFAVVDLLAQRAGQGLRSSWRLKAQVAQIEVGARAVWLAKPQLFVNRSGESLARMARRHGWAPEEMLVVMDDVELPLGRLRLRPQGGHGGHGGMRSIIERLGSRAMPRLRIGIGGNRAGDDLRPHVLGRFAPAERAVMDEAVVRAADAVTAVLENGVDNAMNQYNVRA